ncbi:MAG: DUF4350 domain-containing protein [Candidatus Helarchaeota archaeon]
MVLFGICLLPLIFAPMYSLGSLFSASDPNFGQIYNQYSIFNEGSKGLSQFRDDLQNGNGVPQFEVKTLVSSLSVTNKTDKKSILFIIAPAHIYNPIEIYGLISFLEDGGKIVIAGDFGTTNWLCILNDFDLLFDYLTKTIVGLFGISWGTATMPLGAELKPGILYDEGFNDGNPTNVLIQNFDPVLGAGVTTVKVSQAAAIQVNLFGGFSFFGFGFTTWIPIAASSSMSWLDSNYNGAQDTNENGESHVIAALGRSGNIIILSDPDIFVNENYGDSGVDNKQFVRNIVNFLADADTTQILFDEGHQAKLVPPFFGFILMFVYCSSIGVLSVITPYFIFRTIKRFIPKAEMPKIQKRSELYKKKGKTIYYERMKWFKEKRQFNKALALLYRRLKRSLITGLELKEFDKDLIIEEILKVKPRININRIKANLRRLELIEKNQLKIKDPYDFMHYFYEMRWISDSILS